MSVQDRLERVLLERPDPPSHTHAFRLLRRRHIVVQEIIATRPEAILYRGFGGHVWTAWLIVNGDTVEIHYNEGMPAELVPDDRMVVHTCKLKDL